MRLFFTDRKCNDRMCLGKARILRKMDSDKESLCGILIQKESADQKNIIWCVWTKGLKKSNDFMWIEGNILSSTGEDSMARLRLSMRWRFIWRKNTLSFLWISK